MLCAMTIAILVFNDIFNFRICLAPVIWEDFS